MDQGLGDLALDAPDGEAAALCDLYIGQLVPAGGEEDGAPYLDMGSSESSVKMRLTNTRLSFVQAGAELAYFSDNKLYVTRLEAVEQISIGTDTNGYLDIVTTPTGVGFKWRG